MNSRIRIEPLSIIVAVDQDGGFGKDGEIPWFIPEDLKHFRETTKGGICIMGRRTYEDMFKMVKARQKKKKVLKDILSGRQSFVLTSNSEYEAEGAETFPSLLQAVQSLKADDKREVFAIGGGRVFTEALTWASTVYITVVKGDAYDCDRFFPIDYIESHFRIVDGTETDECWYLTYNRTRR